MWNGGHVAEKQFLLNAGERTRLIEAVKTGLTIPLIDDVEDFIWEAIFAYVKKLALPAIRNKRLFDAIDSKGTGWSLKTLVWSRLTTGSSFEFVIQRADIFKKAGDLGFPDGLDRNTDPGVLGRALIEHWNRKFRADSKAQAVKAPRIAVLLKSIKRDRFVYVEFEYPPLRERDYVWEWSKEGGFGLWGKKDGRVQLKWYYGQKQLFQVFQIPAGAFAFELKWRRHALEEFFRRMQETFP